MPTGDGLLVRILPKDRIAADPFITLCKAARQHGSGIIEITSRGSLQVRGLTPRSARRFAEEVAVLDIAESAPVPILVDPLPDDPEVLIDAAGLAFQLRRAIERGRLSFAPKVSVAVDGGGRLHLDALSADVRLRAFASFEGPRLHVSVAGDAGSATSLGALAPERAVAAVISLLNVIAGRGRAADILREKGSEPFRSAVADDLQSLPVPSVRAPADPIGLHRLRTGQLALGIALAFGQADAEALIDLMGIAGKHGAQAARPAAGRVLLLSGLDDIAAAAVARAAGRLGLITRTDDPRRRIAACPGKPACASGWIAARALANELTPRLQPHAGEIDIHISGCAKGCAHPAPAALTVVGSEHGCGIVRRGSARATPIYHVEPHDLVAEIARAMAAGNVFDA
jgi:precorrin-3B synthase